MGYNKETGMYEGYVYCIENLINGKKYIGYTKNNIETRWNQHLSKTHHREDNSILHLAIKKYKENNFIIYPIHILTNIDQDELIQQLKDMEKSCIKEYNTITPNGYNILSGGETVPVNRIQQVYQYTMDGILMCHYSSITEAIQLTGVSDNPKNSKIRYCLQRSHCAFGYLWNTNNDDNVVDIYVKYMSNRYRHKKHQKYKGVICITTNEIFSNIYDACKKYNVDYSAIIKVCKHKRYSCGKHPITKEKLIWEYFYDSNI